LRRRFGGGAISVARLLQKVLTDWHGLLPPLAADIALMAAAVVCGAIIGVEREKKLKPAGLRTMILIALGSTLFTLLSKVLAEGEPDQGRVAAQIVSGIGFLGAGAILHDTVRIRGLTTAAMIWFTAAIGMLCGAGYGGLAMALTMALTLLMHLVTRIENRYLGPCYYTQVTLLFDDHGGKTSVKIDSILEDYQVTSGPRKVAGEGLTEMSLHYCNAHKHHKAFLFKFADLPEIRQIIRH